MDKKISEYTEKMAGAFNFLLGKEKADISKNMDMRTRVLNLNLMKALLYYGSLFNGYQLNSADESKLLIERLLVGYKGLGRQEAVEVLRQQFAKKVEIEMGKEKGLDAE